MNPISMEEMNRLAECLKKANYTEKEIQKLSSAGLLLKIKQLLLFGVADLTISRRNWKVWKKIKLGTGVRVVEDFGNVLLSAGCKLAGEPGTNLFSNLDFRISTKEEEIRLVLIRPTDILHQDEFKTNGPSYKRFLHRAAKLGLNPCPAEVGPQLRIQYLNQPLVEFVSVAMEPIDFNDEKIVFSVGHRGDNGDLLLTYHAVEAVGPLGKWVFVKG